MVDVNTFLAVFYVMIDDFGKISLARRIAPGSACGAQSQ
jgi:hypothetical protein